MSASRETGHSAALVTSGAAFTMRTVDAAHMARAGGWLLRIRANRPTADSRWRRKWVLNV